MYVYVNMQVCILLHISIIHVCYIKFSVYTCMCMVISIISIYVCVCVACVCVCVRARVCVCVCVCKGHLNASVVLAKDRQSTDAPTAAQHQENTETASPASRVPTGTRRSHRAHGDHEVVA